MSTRTEQRTRQVDVTVIACDHCGTSAETAAQVAGFICCHAFTGGAASTLIAALTGAEAPATQPDRHLCAHCWSGLANYFRGNGPVLSVVPSPPAEGAH